jgi:class 3 adenylate cyclase
MIEDSNLRKFKKRLTLKLTLLIWVLIIIIFLIVTIQNVLQQQKSTLEEAKLRMATVTGIIQRSVATLGIEKFSKWAQSLFDMRFKTEEYNLDIVYVMVLSGKNQIKGFVNNPNLNLTTTDGRLVKPEMLIDGDIPGVAKVDAVVFHSDTNVAKYIIQVGYSVEVLNSVYYRIIRYNLVIGILAMLIGMLGAYFIARNWTRPIRRLSGAMKQVEGGDLNASIEVNRRDEIGMLQNTFNFMVSGLRDKEFIKSTFKRYITRQVAEEILKHRENIVLGGEKREVSILFSDIRGFTNIAEKLTPQETLQLLNDYYGVAVDIIFKHEGVLDKFLGDGIMVFWNAPLEQEEHQLKACRCALELRSEFEKLNIEREKEGNEPIYIGIGINTGEAIAGSVGSEERMEYTVVGDNVNLASRINSKTDRGQILISEQTYKEISNIAIATALPPTMVKGKSKKVKLWLLHSLREEKKEDSE